MKKYLTKFSTRAEYAAALSTLDFPNVSYVDGEDGVIFNAEMPLILDNKISGTHTGDDILVTFEIGYGVDGKKSDTVELPVTGETWEYEWTCDTFSWIGSWHVSPYTAAKMSAPILKSPAPVYTLTLDHFGLDTSECTSVNNWFESSPFSSINISGLDVSSAEEMEWTFMNTIAESIDMSGIDMSSITRLRSLFQNAGSLRTINMDGTVLNTEKGEKGDYTLNVDDMFNGVPSDVSISLRNSDQGTLEILQDALIWTGNCYDATIDTGDLIWTYNKSTKEWEGNTPTTGRYEIRVFDDSVSEMIDEIIPEVEVYVKLYDTETDTYLEDAQDWNLKAYNNATDIESEAVEIEDGSKHGVEGAWYLMVNSLSHEDIDSVRLVAVNALEEEDVLAEKVVTVNGF